MYLMRVPLRGPLKDNPYSRMQKAFTTIDNLAVIYSEDQTDKWGWLKHISISRADRYPSWDEILEVKNQLMGDIDCMMVMPKKEDYVNVHKNCFHIWQCPEGWGMQ